MTSSPFPDMPCSCETMEAICECNQLERAINFYSRGEAENKPEYKMSEEQREFCIEEVLINCPGLIFRDELVGKSDKALAKEVRMSWSDDILLP